MVMGLTWEVWGKAGGGEWKSGSASVLRALDLIRPKVSNQISRKCQLFLFRFGGIDTFVAGDELHAYKTRKLRTPTSGAGDPHILLLRGGGGGGGLGRVPRDLLGLLHA